MATRRVKHSESVLLIMNNDHAARVRDVIQEHKLRSTTSPNEARIDGAIVTALEIIYLKRDGLYVTEFREKLARRIVPRLSRKETTEVMTAVFAVVPPYTETDKIREIREDRRKQLEKKS